jgi:hypothetical protein
MATHEGYLNFFADNKKGGGKGGFIKGLDGWVRFSKKLDLPDDLVKNCKVKVAYSDTDNGILVTKVKVTGAPSSGGGGGGGWKGRGGGGGGKANPATQRSIVMQHSQTAALTFVSMLIEQGAIKLGAANKPEARKIALEELLDEQIARFYTQAADEGPQEFIEEFDADESDEDVDADEDFDDEDEDEGESDDEEDFDDDF